MPAGQPAMEYLGQWFLCCLVIVVFVAYVTRRTRSPGSPYLEVFRVAGTTTFLGDAAAQVQGPVVGGNLQACR